MHSISNYATIFHYYIFGVDYKDPPSSLIAVITVMAALVGVV